MTKEELERTAYAEAMADLIINICEQINRADLTNADQIRVIAGILSLYLQKAVHFGGPDASYLALEYFVRQLTHMHPEIQCMVIEKKPAQYE